jgi:Protein of unknown function (DUF2628)
MMRMSVYTVHEPPLRATEVSPSAERIVFVRDGFSFWVFLFAPWWMLWRRMWLVFVGYVVVTVAVIAALDVLGASQAVLLIVGLLISFLVGLEASTLRRFTLQRRGWKNVGVVSGDDREDAERRFFGAWVRGRSAPRTAVPAAAATPHTARAPDVVGLFPEPGAQP